MKERLTGAIILVALIVLLVPELLTGPVRSAPRSVAVASSRTAITLLHHQARGRSAPARRQRAQRAEQPAPLPPAPAPARVRRRRHSQWRRRWHRRLRSHDPPQLPVCCGGRGGAGGQRRDLRRLRGAARQLRAVQMPTPREEGARAEFAVRRLGAARGGSTGCASDRRTIGRPPGAGAAAACAWAQRRDRAAVVSGAPVTGSSGGARGALVQSAPRGSGLTSGSDERNRLR